MRAVHGVRTTIIKYYITIYIYAGAKVWLNYSRGGIVRAWAVAAVSSEFICLRILCRRVLGRERLRRPASCRTAKYKRQLYTLRIVQQTTMYFIFARGILYLYPRNAPLPLIVINSFKSSVLYFILQQHIPNIE